MRRLDLRTLCIMLIAVFLGAAWAIFNFNSTGGVRAEEQLRPLVWTIFATPFALFLGWAIARRNEVWSAAFICFCFYFFTPFVAARTESLILSPAEASATGHHTYFVAALVLHFVGAIVITLWRALDLDSPAFQESLVQPPVANTEASS